MFAPVALPARAIAAWLGLLVGQLTAGRPPRLRRPTPSATEGIGRSLASAPGISILILGNWGR
jgi:hypothetical protein